MLLSVIVSTRNRRRSLKNPLESFENPALPAANFDYDTMRRALLSQKIEIPGFVPGQPPVDCFYDILDFVKARFRIHS